MSKPFSRRSLLRAGGVSIVFPVARAIADDVAPATAPIEPIIDIHQHTNYSGRTDAQLIEHQKRMGVTQTILLPAGSTVVRPSTNNGVSNGLQAKCGTNDSCVAIARQFPGQYYFFANEVPDLPETREVLS